MNHHTCALRLSLLAISIAYCSAALAESSDRVLAPVAVKDSAIDDNRTYNPWSSKGATKIDAPLRDIPQTINVVPVEVIRDQAATSMQDVLRNVVGVALSSGDGQRDQVFIRGFTAISDQFVDGFRDDSLYFRDLSNIERVEVIKGPAAVLYGRGSSGGLINRVTKKPGSDLTELTLQYGSWDGKRIEGDVGRKGDIVSWRVTAAGEDADSYRDQQFLKRKAIAPSLLIVPDENNSLLLQADYLEDERVTDAGIPAYRGKPVNVDPDTYYGAANAEEADTSRSVVKSFHADYTHDFNDDLSLRNGIRYYHYNLKRYNTFVASANETLLTASFNHTNFLRNEFGWINQTELTQRVRFGGVQHELLYGIELGRQKKNQYRIDANNIATVNLFDPVLPILPGKLTNAPGTDNLGTFDTSAAYVQDMLQIAEQWKALLGVRFDRFKQETDNRLAGQADLSRTDNMWSPRAGLVWQPTTQQSYYVSISKSFQPSGESFAVAANNADIEPEETINREVGAKFDFLDGRLSTTVSLFRLERDGIKTINPVTTQIVPIGTQRTDGVELTATGDFGNGLSLLAGYAYLDAHITKSIAVDAGQLIENNRATLTPYNSANIWLTQALGERYELGLGANYIGDRFANTGNTVTLPGYTTVDAMIAAHLGQVDVQLNLRNLFDREYIVSGHGSSPQLNIPGAPRNATLTARLKF